MSQIEGHGDPLTPAQAKALLASTNVVRDPLHMDIRVTRLERKIVDTPEFQRLRQIKQLAMVDLVYPGAIHNRFLHSLGTLHVCSQMISACNNATKRHRPLVNGTDPIPVRIGHYAELLARLVALLHDLAHIPFGHVLEREAQLFVGRDEWQDPWRVEKIFGAESGIVSVVRTFFADFFGRTSTEFASMPKKEAENAANCLIADIRGVLLAESEDAIMLLRYPFVHDLVGNTICADLIDYVQRDMFFCGLTEGLATRFMQYMGIMPAQIESVDNEKKILRPYRTPNPDAPASPRQEKKGVVSMCRLLLLPYSYNNRHGTVTKPNIIAEAIDLVRRRKTISEKLYFHKTKLIGTAMLAAAAHAFGIHDAEEVWDESDNEILKRMARVSVLGTGDNPYCVSDATCFPKKDRRRRIRTSKIATRLLQRRLFKPIYRLPYHPDDQKLAGDAIWHNETGAYEKFETAEKREALIEKLEFAIGLAHDGNPASGIGAVAISCPNRKMQLKQFKMLVLDNPRRVEIRPLQESVKEITQNEIKIIQQEHLNLWCLEVFLDPQVVSLSDPFVKKLAESLQSEIAPGNDVAEFASKNASPLVELAAELLVESVLKEKSIDKGTVATTPKGNFDTLLAIAKENCFRANAKATVAKAVKNLFVTTGTKRQPMFDSIWAVIDPYIRTTTDKERQRVRTRLRKLDRQANREEWTDSRRSELVAKFELRKLSLPEEAYVHNRIDKVLGTVDGLVGLSEEEG